MGGLEGDPGDGGGCDGRRDQMSLLSRFRLASTQTRQGWR
jgi:hypothetical protein